MLTQAELDEKARAMAEATGSIGATYIEEERLADGTLVELRRGTWTKESK